MTTREQLDKIIDRGQPSLAHVSTEELFEWIGHCATFEEEEELRGELIRRGWGG